MSFVQEREKRSNAGSRMRALLEQEVEMEELFEYDENDEEDEEFDTKMTEEEEDKVDSDFDESSEGEQDYLEEGEKLDKEIAKAEKKSRRAIALNFPPAVAPTTIKPIKKLAEKKRKIPKSMDLETYEERSTRHSSRKNTMLNRILVEDQIRENQKKKALQPKKDRPTIDKLTQEELLAEAAITEEKNRDSLLEWQKKEAERKENAKKQDKKEINGPFVRYHSFVDGAYQVSPEMRQSISAIDNQDNATGSEPPTTDQTALVIQDNDLMGRNLISFMNLGNKKNTEEGEALQKKLPLASTTTKTEGGEQDSNDLEFVGLIDELSDWLDRKPKPAKPIQCPITGYTAKYCDPNTNIPYSDLKAYNTIKSCLSHDMNWSATAGLYLGNLPSAEGVPEGWDL